MIEEIKADKLILGYIYRGGVKDQTHFITPIECNQQVGFIVCNAGDKIPRHYHKERSTPSIINKMTEVLLVIEGEGNIDFYYKLDLLCSKTISRGDVLILMEGGHGFSADKRLVFFEVKQGPYVGDEEKVRF